MDIRERRLTTTEMQDFTRPLQNDLIAFYGVLADAADSLLDKAEREGWTPERYIDELERLISGDNRPPETVPVGPLSELQVNRARTPAVVLGEVQKSLNTIKAMRRG